MIEIVNAMPAIQWSSTQSNFQPRIGANEVTRSVNIDAAMIQWNARAANEWRGTRSGTRAAKAAIHRRGRRTRRLRPELHKQRMSEHEKHAERKRRVDEVPLRVRQDSSFQGLRPV